MMYVIVHILDIDVCCLIVRFVVVVYDSQGCICLYPILSPLLLVVENLLDIVGF